MKKILAYILFVVIMVVILPLIILEGYDDISLNSQKLVLEDKIKVYDPVKDLVFDMDIEEYIKCVVASEMPALFEQEALKAQAIAARTFAYKKIKNGEDNIHSDANVCTDFRHCQAYSDKTSILEKWGDDAKNNWEKISKAVDDTKYLVISYNKDLILPVFHANSIGKTESSKEVWSCVDIPYLQSVESVSYDDLEKSRTYVELDIRDFKQTIQKEYPNITFSGDVFSNIKEIVRNQSGRVKYIDISGVKIKGEKIREMFCLKSTNFKIINIGGNKIRMEVLGSGHGVGLSQVGANEMAKMGKSYQEILKHYYKGVDIIQAK